MAFEFKITATLALDDLNRKDFSTMASSSDIATSTFSSQHSFSICCRTNSFTSSAVGIGTASIHPRAVKAS
jgi:hypothetical protein